MIVVTGLPANQVFVDLPADQTVSAIAKGTVDACISVFDMKSPRNTTRFMASRGPVVTTQTKAIIDFSPGSTNQLDPGQSQSLTISEDGAFIANDAVGVTLWNIHDSNGTAVIVNMLPAPDTPTDMAQKLADAINDQPILQDWVTAVAVGAEVTITNNLPNALKLSATAGNIATQAQLMAQEERAIQISLWTRTEPLREQYAELIKQWIADKQFNFGIQLADTSWARIKYNNEVWTKDTHLADIYRVIFTVDAEVSVIKNNTLYSVLAILQTETVG